MGGTRRTRRILRLVVAGLVMAAASGVGPDAGPVQAGVAQEAGPTMTVTPSTDLVDAQRVAVEGSGFPLQQGVALAQCPDAATSFQGCRWGHESSWSEDGSLDASFTMWAVLRLPDADVDCRTAADACALAAFVYDDGSEGWVEMARVPLNFDPDGALAPEPTLSTTPGQDLVDGQTVTVTGAHFLRDNFVEVIQCTADPTSWSDCDSETSSYDEPTDGAFQLDQRVFVFITTADGRTIDCRVDQCVVTAVAEFVPGEMATAPLAFDPDGPLLPPPTLTATPATHLVDGQSVRIEGSNFNRSRFVQTYQCAPRPSWDRCRATDEEYHRVDEAGHFSTEVVVNARVRTPEELVDCRTSVEPCVLVAGPISNPDLAGQAELHFDPDGPLRPDPTMTATPTTDLGDFTPMTVQGDNFTPGQQARVELCSAGTPRRCDWENAESPTADDDGHITTELGVFASFEVEAPGSPLTIDCRVAPGCVLVAADTPRDAEVTTSLSFGPPDGPRGRYRDVVFDDVEVIRDVVYRHTADSEGNPVDLALDIYRPAGDTATARPAVIWLYGGWFKFGDKSDFYVVDYATEWAKRGYVAVAMNYRVRPDLDTTNLAELAAAMFDAYDDGVAGAQWLRDHAAEFGIDAEAISATGYSAGAVTSLNMAYMPGDRGPATSPIAAAAPIAGLLAADVEAGDPPSIVFRGTHDTTLPAEFNNTDRLCPIAEPLGIACEYVGYDGAGHEIVNRWRDIMWRSTDFVSDEVLAPVGYFDVGADAGGDYEVDEGSAVMLDGSGSSGSGLTYAWSPADLVDDTTSATPTFPGLDDGAASLGLTVANDHGIAATDTATVTTRNVAPTVASGVATATPGTSTVAIEATATDPGVDDTHTATVDWGDGATGPANVTQSAGSAVVHGNHAYAAGGRYTITVTVVDDDGGSGTWSTTVAVGCTVNGTDRTDVLVGTPGNDVICAGKGNDIVLGLGGNDTILGGDGNDLLLGGDGDDVLDGQAGWDLALGGGGTNICTAEVRLNCRRPGR